MGKTVEKFIPLLKSKQKLQNFCKGARCSKDGDIVAISVEHQSGRIEKILGNVHEPKGLHLLSILAMDLPTAFSDEAIKIAQKVRCQV